MINGSEAYSVLRGKAATSSYITVPPPFTHVYSAGGPTGEVHAIDPTTGGFGEKLQQILFVPEDKLESADKTRVALVRREAFLYRMPPINRRPLALWLACR